MTTTTISCSILSMITKSKQRITLFINPDLLIQARAKAVVERNSLTELVEKALLEYLPSEIVIKKPKID